MGKRRYLALLLAGVMMITAVPGEMVSAAEYSEETEWGLETELETATDLEAVPEWEEVTEEEKDAASQVQNGVCRATFDGTSTKKEIQSALNLIRDGQASQVELTLRGNIQINGGLVVYSNTTINATGATITETTSGGSLLTSATARYYGSVPYSAGYQKTQNIKVIGGTWDGSRSAGQVIRFVHSSNVEIDGVTVKNCTDTGHLITLEGVRQATVKNSTLLGHSGMGASKEALHIDIVHSTQTTPSLQSDEYDDLPDRDITITNNVIKDVPNAIGSHGSVQGVYHQNIVITNNQISNVSNVALPIFNYRNVTISNNVIRNASQGIKVYACQSSTAPLPGTVTEAEPYEQNYQIVITGNTVSDTTGGFPLQVQGSPDRKMAGITIQDNRITGVVNGTGIFAEFLTGGVIAQNQVTTGMADRTELGISLNNAQNMTITGNTVANANSVGIKIENKSHNAKLTRNVIQNVKKVGVYALDSKLDIENNTVTDISGEALCIWNAGRNMKIRKNKIKNVKSIGIGLNNVKRAQIIGNEIENVRGNVINLNVATANVKTRKKTVVYRTSSQKKTVSGKATKGSKYQIVVRGRKYKAVIKNGKFRTSKIKAIRSGTEITVIETMTGKNKIITTTKAR